MKRRKGLTTTCILEDTSRRQSKRFAGGKYREAESGVRDRRPGGKRPRAQRASSPRWVRKEKNISRERGLR